MSSGEIQIHTIGFTRKSARQFFDALRNAKIRRVVDVRLNNVSQLAGFSKKDDLAYFLGEIGGIDYVHEPSLAPTAEILKAFKTEGGSWAAYAARFMALMEQRRIEHQFAPATFDGTCLLCSEAEPHHCHRRLVAEYLQRKWACVRVHHLT